MRVDGPTGQQRFGALAFFMFVSACGGSSPATPTPVPTPTPPVASNTSDTPCPTAILPGFTVDLAFYRQIGCNGFDGPQQFPRRWDVAPKLYIRTVDEAGAAIDAVTLDTVQAAMVNVAAQFTGGKFGLASVERGVETREGRSGYVTVKWPHAVTGQACGQSQVSIDGGWIELNYTVTSCACNGSAIRARTAKHELGHALGYWHTDSAGDLMSGLQTSGCDADLSARERQAIAYHYR